MNVNISEYPFLASPKSKTQIRYAEDIIIDGTGF
jgi:hypothetical protein